MPDLNFQDLFGGNDTSSGIQTAALMQAIRQRQAAGMLGLATGDPAMSAIGKELTGEANQYQRTAQAAGQFRGLHGPAIRADIEARNPNSFMGQAGRQLAGQLGIDVPEGTPYSSYESLLPEAGRALAAKAMANYRTGMLDLGNRRVAVAEQRLTQAGYHWDPGIQDWVHNPGAPKATPRKPVPGAPNPPAAADGSSPPAPGAAAPGSPPAPGGGGAAPVPPPLRGKQLSDSLQKFGQDLDPNGARAGEMGKNMARYNAGRRVLALATDENGNPHNLSPQFMTELFTSLATLINQGGQPAESLIRELTPYTKGRKFAEWQQWFSDNPVGADQVGFVKQAVDSAKREMGVARDAISQAATQRVGKHQVLIQRNPQEAVLAADRYGYTLDPKTMTLTPKEPAAPAPRAAAVSDQDKAAKAWADANPNDPRAAKIRDMLKAKGL